jgi:hypothetical protein
MNFFIDFQMSPTIATGTPVIIAALFAIMFSPPLCKYWNSVIELGNFDLVSMARFGFHDPAIVHMRDGIGVVKYTGIMCYDDYGPLGMDSIFS